MCRGVYLSGEDNPKEYPEGNQFLAVYEERGMKVPLVTWIRPETGRSTPGQREVGIKPYGGVQRFYVQVHF